MANLTSSVNVDALRKAQEEASNEASEAMKKYGDANTQVNEHIGNEGDGALGGKLGNFVNSTWAEDTAQAVKNYQAEAEHLLQDALGRIAKGAGELSSETESLYKNN